MAEDKAPVIAPITEEAPPLPFSTDIDVDTIKEKGWGLFIGLPMYGGQCYGTFAMSIAETRLYFRELGIPLHIWPLYNESLITRARNYCSHLFMEHPQFKGLTNFLFIDADISFNPQDILAMMWMQNMAEDYDIVAGPYPKKCISWEKIAYAVEKGLAQKDPNVLERFVGDFVFNPKPVPDGKKVYITQPMEVLEAGTGFMMIKRNVFERFKKAYPHYMFKPDHVRSSEFDGSKECMQYFQAEIDQLDFGHAYRNLLKKLYETEGIDVKATIEQEMEKIDEEAKKKSRRYLSEDYWFCQKAGAIGCKTWMLPWVRLQHTGTYTFGGSLVDMIAVGMSPTADAKTVAKST